MMRTELVIAAETANVLAAMFGAFIGAIASAVAALGERSRRREREMQRRLALSSQGSRASGFRGRTEAPLARQEATLALSRIESERSRMLVNAALVYGFLVPFVGIALSFVVDQVSFAAILLGMAISVGFAVIATYLSRQSVVDVTHARLLKTLPSESLTASHQVIEAAVVDHLISDGWQVEPSKGFDIRATRHDRSVEVEIRAKSSIDRSDLRQMSDRVASVRLDKDGSCFVLVVPSTAMDNVSEGLLEEYTQSFAVYTIDREGRLSQFRGAHALTPTG